MNGNLSEPRVFKIPNGGFAAVSTLSVDCSGRVAIETNPPDRINAFFQEILTSAHATGTTFALHLTGGPDTDGIKPWFVIQHTAASEALATDTCRRAGAAVQAAFDMLNPGTMNHSDTDPFPDIEDYALFTEFVQRESWPAPRTPKPGLDYLYCIEPFNLVPADSTSALTASLPVARDFWTLEIQLHPTVLNSGERDVLPQIIQMIAPLAQHRREHHVSELTGVQRTHQTEADPGAVKCVNGFRDLHSRLSDGPVFITTIRLFTRDPVDMQALSTWIQTTILKQQSVSTLSDTLSSPRGTLVKQSWHRLTPSELTACDVWSRNDAPTVLKRLHRMLPLKQASILAANSILPGGRKPVPAKSTETFTPVHEPDADDSLYHSFYLHRQRTTDTGHTDSRAPSNPQSGQPLLPERYRVVEHLGSGAMGDVYAVIDTELDRPFAVKILKQNLSTDPRRVQQFKSEVSLTQDLMDEGIVRMHHLDIFNNRYYCVMEQVRGTNLADHLASLTKGMDAESARFILMHICRAMSIAHAHDVIHRDLKPGNIILLPNQHIKILDFGLASLKSHRDAALTGSIGYIAPEILQGEPADERSDVFSVGAMGYEMLTLKKPGGYIAPDLGRCDEIAPAFAAVILTAMHGDPQQRIQSMETFGEKLFEI